MTIFHTGEEKKNISENGNSVSVSSSCFAEDTFHMTLACKTGRRGEREDGEEGGGGKNRKTGSWRGRRGKKLPLSTPEIGFILNQNTSLFPQKSAALVEFVQKL